MIQIFLTANCYSTRGRPADQGEAVLRLVNVRGHSHAHSQLSAGQRVARTPTQQRCHARGRVHRVPPALERHAVCLLYPCGHPRVHCRVCHFNWCNFHRDTNTCYILHFYHILCDRRFRNIRLVYVKCFEHTMV